MRLAIFFIFVSFSLQFCFAGNPERSGQAGPTQLLVNPYARSSGINGLNITTCTGVESVINNPAGLAYTKSTELVVAHSRWMVGAGLSINAIGFSQNLGRAGVVGLSVMSFNSGQIPITTIDNPDGGLGEYSVTSLNLGVTYAKMMVEDRIYVGLTVKVIHESVPSVGATGVAFDAGVQYRTKNGKFRLGVTLKNIGPAMNHSGDGLSARASLGPGNDNAVYTQTENFQMPSQLLIGVAYEFRSKKMHYRYKFKKEISRRDTMVVKLDSMPVFEHKVIPMLTFVSNTFSRDQIGLGVEYRYREMFMLRAAYVYEQDFYTIDKSRNQFTGLAVGASFEFPFSMKDPKTGAKNKRLTTIGVDYSYSQTFLFGGTHCMGLRLAL